MTNTSATGGFLSPAVVTPPQEDADLEAIVQALVVNITGLAGSLIFPRWQPTIPKQPAASVTWCAMSVNVTDGDINPTITHDGAANGGLGASTLCRTEELEVDASFYGPLGQTYAALPSRWFEYRSEPGSTEGAEYSLRGYQQVHACRRTRQPAMDQARRLDHQSSPHGLAYLRDRKRHKSSGHRHRRLWKRSGRSDSHISDLNRTIAIWRQA